MKKAIVILLILITTTNISSCQNKKDNNEVMKVSKNDKYDFMASSCAPMAYPAIVVSGNFYLADGTSLYIPAGGRLLKYGWHADGATHVTGPDLKALPNELSVTWLSLAEKKFYTGRFKLDYDLIVKYFKKGFYDHHKDYHTYRKINAGLAPGGVVVVWLDGIGSRVEIGRYKAKETEVTMKNFVPTTNIPKEEYINDKFDRHIINEVKEEITQGKISFGLWDTYRIKYNWQPKLVFANGGKATLMSIDYYNGESVLTYADNPEIIGYKNNAVPKDIGINWEDKNGNKFGADIRIGYKYKKTDDYKEFKEKEKEIFEAFKKINTSSTDKQIDLLFKIDRYNSTLKLFLKNDKEEIEIKKAAIKIYENS